MSLWHKIAGGVTSDWLSWSGQVWSQAGAVINLTAVEANTTEQWILPAYIAYTSFVLFSLVLAVGVVGNVLVLIVILTSKSMRSSTNLFLLNLSIADLLVLIVCCPNAMIEMYMRRVGSLEPSILSYGTFYFDLTAGYLGDGQGDVPAGSLHRADGVPHLRPHHPRHHSGEVSHQHQSDILFSSPSKYGSKQENYNETE